MDFPRLPRRFSDQGRHTFDHWQNEKLKRMTVANTPENLLRINKIFSFHSNFMQGIVDFRENNFEINILTQPFLANSDSVLAAQTETQARSILRQYLAFLRAAREWNMDFIDFTKFQILPGATLRLGWELKGHDFPDASAFIPIFTKNSHLRFLKKDYCPEFEEDQSRPVSRQSPYGYLFRQDDFASNLLHAHSMLEVKSSANLKIRINTKEPWLTKIIQNTLFHNLDSEEILLMKIPVNDMPMSDFFSAFSGDRESRQKNTACLVREFGLYLKQSVFQKTIMVIDGLEEKMDGQFLRFLLESGDITGLTVILFNDALHLDCDLELNEDPDNQLQKHLPTPSPARKQAGLSHEESELLGLFAAIGAPIPMAVARIMDRPGKASRTKALLEKNYLHEDRGFLSLRAPNEIRAAPADQIKPQLGLLAAKTDWPYLSILYFIACENLPALEQYLKALACEGTENIAPGPACDLIVRQLPKLAKNQKIIIHFLEILIQANELGLAEKLLNEYADPNAALTRLQAAHLAMRKKEYQKLERLLAGLEQVRGEYGDKWLYLNFISLDKSSETAKADAFAKKIRDPYFRHLAAVQLSDRKIYKGDFARAQALLDGALGYFQARRCGREEIEILSQIAKLQREKGSFAAAESSYKTIFVKSESEDFRLNSAFTAVDLGNLYLENDDDFQAECWYQKALKLFEKEKNGDGIMLVNSNLINIFTHQGNWKEAENLLRAVLAHNEEKKLPVSCAIDCLNWANLEYLRLNHGRALKLIERATKIFEKSGHHKGLAECALLKCRISFLASRAPDPLAPGVAFFSGDQKIVWNICQRGGPAGGHDQGPALEKQLAAIQSNKIKFATLAMLLNRSYQPEWLDMLREISRNLSEKSKNYFYYAYWYAYFDQVPGAGSMDGMSRETFLAMHDFFSMNKRRISEKLERMRTDLDESENRGSLFDDARLVENHRHWRHPEDFFSSFSSEINKTQRVDWLVMQFYEKEQPLFAFSNSDQFKELAKEMIDHLRRKPEIQNFFLTEIKTKFISQEKIFYPFANTKMMRWPIADDLSAGIVVAFKDKDQYFQNFFERHREVLNKLALLFRNFFKNEYQVREKLDFIIGASEKINEMKRLIVQVSKVDFSLLISGESGSGKELVARAVHRLSPRANQPFISVNAAALPETLLEAELFGFKKGAFSGAAENRVGLLEAADRGTFFLDEIADLPLSLQAKMLRVLQEKEIRRLGENKTIPIDIRLISASNKNLEKLIIANQFREDLFYRLQDLTIHIPPLRERREDIPLLIAHFLNKFSYPASGAHQAQCIAELFQNECFPGNVRELESKIKKLITFDPDLEHLPQMEKKKFSLQNARREFECTLLLNALNETGWNKSKTAEKLGISRMVLFNMIKKYNLKK